MNTSTSPAAASESSSRDNPCYGTDPTAATLNVLTDDERSYQLPYAQFLYAEITPNPALEKDVDAPPEKLLICFAAAKVTVLGRGLTSLEKGLQRYELKFVKSAAPRYARLFNTHVAAITVSLSKETQ